MNINQTDKFVTLKQLVAIAQSGPETYEQF